MKREYNKNLRRLSAKGERAGNNSVIIVLLRFIFSKLSRILHAFCCGYRISSTRLHTQTLTAQGYAFTQISRKKTQTGITQERQEQGKEKRAQGPVEGHAEADRCESPEQRS
jgi:hypothetical protein